MCHSHTRECFIIYDRDKHPGTEFQEIMPWDMNKIPALYYLAGMREVYDHDKMGESKKWFLMAAKQIQDGE